MNKKGFTVVELIVSFSLTVVITIFLVQIVSALNNLYNNSGVKTELLTKQSLISSQINSKLNEKSISSLTDCGNYCIKFNYSDNTSDILKIDYANNTLEFGSFLTDLPNNSYFKDVRIDVIYAATVQTDVNNAMLNIVIPIYSDDIEGDYGVNIVYQFNSDNTNIEYFDFTGKGEYIVLNGETEQTFNTQTAYVEQGYTVYDKDGNIITGTVVIDNPLESVPYKAGNYKIKYSLVDGNNNIISQTTRSITVTPSTYEITNLVTNGSFEDGLDSWYTTYHQSLSIETIDDNSLSNFGSKSSYIDFNIGGWYQQSITTVSANKYYAVLYVNLVEVSSSNAGIRIIETTNRNVEFGYTIPNVTNGYKKLSGIFNASTNNTEIWFGGDTAGSKAYFDGYLLVDLTETFGAGNEPSKEWCDENIEWFDGTIKINY